MHNIDTPKLIIISGCAGAGKTTLAKRLAKELHTAYIDKDAATRRLVDYALDANGSNSGDRESSIYAETIRPLEYDTMLALAKDNLELGMPVIVSAPFIAQITCAREWLKALAILGNTEYETKIIWIVHDIDAEKKRIVQRGAKRNSGKLCDWRQYSRSIENIEPAEELDVFFFANDCDCNDARYGDKINSIMRFINS